MEKYLGEARPRFVQEHDGGLRSTDPLAFTDTKPYRQRLESSIEGTGFNDAVITATGVCGL